MLTALYAKLQTRMASDEGATAVEYGIMVAGIAVLIVATVFLLGGRLDALFEEVRVAIS